MSRRRQTPWIHRNSRYLIGGIALLGAINTGYLTLTKFLGGETACPTDGCEQVLSSSYAEIFGLPLALFGFLAYVGMAVLALGPIAIKPESNKELRTTLDNWSWLLLFVGSTAMMVFSGYLMYIMATVFVAKYGPASVCIYCIVSAIFATTLFVLTLLGRAWEDIGQLLFTGIIVAMVVLVGALGVYANQGGSSATPGSDAPAVEGAGPAITTSSGPSEIALARHLTEIGAKMYGAYWCPHCHDQKQLFGKEAFAQATYVECAPDGLNSQTALCRSHSEITGFPTWEINGQFYPGTRSLNELADLSGYQGPRNFRNN